MLSVRSLRLFALACLFLTGIGCTLITEVDRTKIPSDGGGGEAPSGDDSSDE